MSLRLSKALLLLKRGLRLRCPECGQEPIYETMTRVRHHCPNCGTLFHREQGYFMGAVYVNVIATETLLFIGLLIFLFASPSSEDAAYKLLLVLAVVLPILFFRHSRSLWLCFDHFFDPHERIGHE